MPLLAIASFALVVSAIVVLFGAINQEKVTDSVGPFQGVFGLGMLGAAISAVSEPGFVSLALAPMTLGLGAFLLYLLSIRKVPDGQLIAVVGERMPPVMALDAAGHDFDLKEKLGRRVMVKFFRGEW
jgi:hypothetical protein